MLGHARVNNTYFLFNIFIYLPGIIYDLIECLAGQMELNGLSTIPLFFLSPVADSSLAYSNIMSEWLSSAKHNRVYQPEEPFVHGILNRNRRLISFRSLQVRRTWLIQISLKTSTAFNLAHSTA